MLLYLLLTTTALLATSAKGDDDLLQSTAYHCDVQFNHSICPHDWWHLSTRQCMLLYDVPNDYNYALRRCTECAADLPDMNSLDSLKDCVLRAANEASWKNAELWVKGEETFKFTRKVWQPASNTTRNVNGENFHLFACVMPENYHSINTTFIIEDRGQHLLTTSSTDLPRDFHTSLGQSLTFICESSNGSPVPLLALKMNGKNIITKPNSSQVVFQHNVSFDQCNGMEQILTCEASRCFDTANSTIELVTQCPSMIVSFTSYNADSSLSNGRGTTEAYTYNKGDNVTLACRVNGSPKPSVTVRKINDKKLLPVEEERADYLVSRLNRMDCNASGMYVCEARQNDTVNEMSVSIGVHGCSPHLCHEKVQPQDKVSEEDQSMTYSLCVVAYPELADEASFNGKMISRGQQNPNFSWNHEENAGFSSYTVTFTIHNASSLEGMALTFEISTTEGYELPIIIYQIIPKEDISNEDGSATTTPTLPSMSKDSINAEENSDNVSTPPALIVFLTITIAIVIFACFVLGLWIAVYKTRGKILQWCPYTRFMPEARSTTSSASRPTHIYDEVQDNGHTYVNVKPDVSNRRSVHDTFTQQETEHFNI